MVSGQPAPRKAFTEAAEDIRDFGQSTPRLKHAVQVIAMNVVESQEVLDAVRTMVGGTPSNRAASSRPGHTALRPDLQRSPLVEAQHDGPRWATPVEAPD